MKAGACAVAAFAASNQPGRTLLLESSLYSCHEATAVDIRPAVVANRNRFMRCVIEPVFSELSGCHERYVAVMIALRGEFKQVPRKPGKRREQLTVTEAGPRRDDTEYGTRRDNKAGRATVGTLCQGDRSHSVSVIEDRGAFQSVRTAVHELGHSLNASHDGDPGNSCSPSDNFIMASGNMTEQTTANSRNPWLFSPCTAQEIQKYVDSLLNDQSSLQCLQTRLSPDSVPDVTGVIPGQLYNADTQCQHLYGSTSSYCFGGNLSNICTYMPCRDTTDILRQCKVHFAATGTSCGDKQWCEAGACVNSSSAPEIGCPYGDRKGGCVREVCQLIEPNGFVYAENCCGTCGFDSSKWTCADAAEVDGLPCADAVRRQGIQGCYNTTLAYLCCATCDRQRDLSRPG
ncbi:hypothetical protein BaRGS_00023027, partial [Batillaria attramentaria]